MSANSKLLNASMHGGIGNGIGYGIDMPDTRNKQLQSKMTSNNDMDIDINDARRIAIKRKRPDDGLTDDIAKKGNRQHRISAYIFWKFPALFVHFAVDINEQQLTHPQNFNDEKDGQMEQKENQDGKHIVRQPRCDIYRKTFASEQKKKREED
ncbi:hypothetical protein RFI_38034 [Reticulomyxa filosa]|uniref:Uncharacterized protein n=1 Tax=Reticulomyxa filosa TaxID=46433 RepID=X6LDL7_RETFI|nr:hypothetical protein RFI_38034 [Reticulomyxa filosa]|eukprot:ETN99440.1 hypothetical protein RFI_38034 [Reticulomyxa filosa]